MAGRTQRLHVDTDELRARAKELEAPIPGLPGKNPAPSCGLGIAATRTRDIALNADIVRSYLDAGQRERQRLGQALRSAAKAYDEMDQNAAEAINTGKPLSTALPEPVEIPTPAFERKDRPSASTPNGGGYLNWKTGVVQVHSGDQGASLGKFSDAWTDHRHNLRAAATRHFAPFQSWDGEAAAAAQAAIEQHRQWLYQMAELCAMLASQAKDLKSAQSWIWDNHPTTTDLKRYTRFFNKQEKWVGGYTPKLPDSLAAEHALDWGQLHYRKQARWLNRWFQRKSERTLREYTQKTALSAVNPSAPQAIPGDFVSPPAQPGGPPAQPGGGGGVADPFSPIIPTAPISNSALTPDQPLSDLPLSDLPTNGLPQSPDSGRPAAASAGVPKLPIGPALKPASIGNGGGGAMPALPLQSALGAEAGSTAGREVAGIGRGIPTVGGALGGGGGAGLAPIGPGGGPNQEAGKGKRGPQPDETLYTEERPHTEGIIGQRRRNDAPDKKDAK